MGDLELQAAELLAQALLAERSGRAVGAARVALDRRVQVDGRFGEARRRGDQAGLDLAGAPALADDEIAQHALAAALVVGGDRLAAGPVADLVAGGVAGLGGEPAVLDADDPVPAAAGVEAERRLAVRPRRRSTRACCGSATARAPARSARARTARGRRSAPAPRRPVPPCGRAGARRGGPARGRRGRAPLRARSGRRGGRRPAAAARPSSPRRSDASSWSPPPARGRRAGRPRRRRRARRLAPPPARRRRASRSPARAGPTQA